jgi:hypothetical protein
VVTALGGHGGRCRWSQGPAGRRSGMGNELAHAGSSPQIVTGNGGRRGGLHWTTPTDVAVFSGEPMTNKNNEKNNPGVWGILAVPDRPSSAARAVCGLCASLSVHSAGPRFPGNEAPRNGRPPRQGGAVPWTSRSEC